MVSPTIGKGPQKEMYEGRIAQMKFQHVCILTAWLTLEQYAHLLGWSEGWGMQPGKRTNIPLLSPSN